MCRGEMKSSLGVVKVGILRLRLLGGWTRGGVGSSGAVVSCLGGDGGRTPPPILMLDMQGTNEAGNLLWGIAHM